MHLSLINVYLMLSQCLSEIDAIATKRFDAQTGADREVQRILLELLNQMDGFDQVTSTYLLRILFLFF
jgi:ATP-dependent 26S proteasome regulatory subunit